MVLRSVAALLILALTPTVQASDLAKEQRWASQIVDALMDGEAVYLNDGTSDFLTIFTESARETDKAAIVVHGSGVHPDWPTVIQPLRVSLAEQGYHTLSIQAPILANEAAYHEYAAVYPGIIPRMEAAKAYLKEQGAKKIAIVAHSLGAGMSAYYLANGGTGIDAFVAVGMGAPGEPAELNNIAHLKSIRIPMLDLYGSEDLEGVLTSAGDRAQAQSRNPRYKQRISPGADHFFEGEEEDLNAAVADWLAEVIP